MRIFIFMLCFSVSHLYAQHIPTKGNLGVKLANAPANDHKGVFSIAEVMPNSTAQNLGLQQHDILISLQGVLIDGNLILSQTISTFVAGKMATAKVLRDQQIVALEGKIMPAPTFKKENHNQELLEIPFQNGYVRGYLTYPKGKGPFPTMYFIQGYPCQSINSHPQHPVLQLTAGMVDLGYAVFRIEKPGVGAFHNLNPCMSYSFEDEVENFSNGLDFIAKHKMVDQDQIYLFGHSLGGNVAPILGQSEKVAGIMVYGTIIKNWQDYLLDMAYYSQTFAQHPEEVSLELPTLKSALQKIYIESISHNDLSTKEKELLADWHDYNAEAGMVFNRDIEFWKRFNERNYFTEWSKIKVPVLAMYGSSDVHAIGSLDAELIARTVNQAQDASLASFMIVEETNHLLANVIDKKTEFNYLLNGLSGQIAFTQFNQNFPSLLDEWIKKDKSNTETELYKYATALIPSEHTKMSSMDVVIEDMNGDDKKDILLATEFGPNQLFIYTDQKWEPVTLPALQEYKAPYLGEDSEDIAVADFDNDGDKDMFFVSEDTDHHELIYNTGNATFTIHDFQIPKIGQANAVLAHDFNNDGWMDVLIGIRGQNELYINKKGERFELQTDKYWVENSDHTQDLIAIDVDNDGDVDIVEGIEQGGNNIYINDKGKYRNEPDRLPLPDDIETRKVVAHDIDGDKDLDLFYCNVGWNPTKNPQNQLLLNDGKGHFTNVTHWLPKDGATTLDGIFTDINQNGKIDLITTNFVNDQKVQVYSNTSMTKDQLTFEANHALLPDLFFFGGTSVIQFEVDGTEYLYFANFKSKDNLLVTTR